MNLDSLFWNNQFPGLFTKLEGSWIIKPIKSFIKGHVANSIKNKLSNCISTIFINQALLNFIFENLRSFIKNLISFILGRWTIILFCFWNYCSGQTHWSWHFSFGFAIFGWTISFLLETRRWNCVSMTKLSTFFWLLKSWTC